MIEKADAKRINLMLGVQHFKSHLIIYSDEVQEITGLTIEELFLCWIFSSENGFKESLQQWKSSGDLMDFEQIQGL